MPRTDNLTALVSESEDSIETPGAFLYCFNETGELSVTLISSKQTDMNIVLTNLNAKWKRCWKNYE
jgi:hypothetical protein